MGLKNDHRMLSTYIQVGDCVVKWTLHLPGRVTHPHRTHAHVTWNILKQNIFNTLTNSNDPHTVTFNKMQSIIIMIIMIIIIILITVVVFQWRRHRGMVESRLQNPAPSCSDPSWDSRKTVEKFFIYRDEFIIILIAFDNAPYKMLHKLKSACSVRKNNSEQVCHQLFCKSRSYCQVPQFNRQLIPTAGTSNSKGSRTPIRPVARYNKIPTNGGSQSRRIRNCWTLSPKSNKVSRSKTFRGVSCMYIVAFHGSPARENCSDPHIFRAGTPLYYSNVDQNCSAYLILNKSTR